MSADRLDGEQLAVQLRRLAEQAVVPPIDPAQEQRLLAAFDEHWNSRRRLHAWPVTIAGLLAVAATIVFAVARREPPAPTPNPLAARAVVAAALPVVPPPVSMAVQRPSAASPTAASRAAHEFVLWPGADELPRFESGQLMRVQLPAPVAVSLGLRPRRPLRDDGTVQTDVLVGQDGYARAVRLVR
ncbi:MAG TPA: hypothetical protein VIW45_21225 [Vicinamibacterales bacterium]|jgi:hypothetical protein